MGCKVLGLGFQFVMPLAIEIFLQTPVAGGKSILAYWSCCGVCKQPFSVSIQNTN